MRVLVYFILYYIREINLFMATITTTVYNMYTHTYIMVVTLMYKYILFSVYRVVVYSNNNNNNIIIG